MSPEVNAEPSMLLTVQLQERSCSTLYCFNCTTGCSHGNHSNVQCSPFQKTCTHGIIFQENVKVKASRVPRKNMTGVLKMAAKKAILEMRNITESAHPFVIKSINKVTPWFLHHCNGNVDDFLTCYPNLKHKTFKGTCESWWRDRLREWGYMNILNCLKNIRQHNKLTKIGVKGWSSSWGKVPLIVHL